MTAMRSNPASSAVRATVARSAPSCEGPAGEPKSGICNPIFTSVPPSGSCSRAGAGLGGHVQYARAAHQRRPQAPGCGTRFSAFTRMAASHRGRRCWLATSSPRQQEGVIGMAGMLLVRRSRGALSGVLLILLGIWGGIIPFVGPYVHYAYTPARAWTYTSGRFWLDVLPAIGTVVGGVIVLASRLRPATLLGAWLAALSGCWFAIGNLLAPLWNSAVTAGQPTGGSLHRAVEQIGFFTALALGRLSVLAIRDVRAAEEAALATGTRAAEPAAAGAAAAGATAPRTPLGRVFAARATSQPDQSGPLPAAAKRVGRHSASTT